MPAEMAECIINQDRHKIAAEKYVVRMKIAVYRAYIGGGLVLFYCFQNAARIPEGLPVDSCVAALGKDVRQRICEQSLWSFSEVCVVLIAKIESGYRAYV